MLFNSQTTHRLFIKVSLILLLIYPASAFSGEVVWSKRPNEFSEIHLINVNVDEIVRESQEKNKLNTRGLVGEIVYELFLDESGWYQLLVEGTVSNLDFYLDNANTSEVIKSYEFHGVNNPEGFEQKVGNVWLNRGKHRLVLSRYVWTGFPTINKIKLLKSATSLADSVQIINAHRRVSEKNNCRSYTMIAGKRSDSKKLEWQIVDKKTRTTIGRGGIEVPASDQLSKLNLNFPCEYEGGFEVIFLERDQKISKKDIPLIEYDVVDTEIKHEFIKSESLIKDIDVANIKPDYFSDATYSVNNNSSSRWLESDDSGWIPFVRRDKNKKYFSKMPTWFAYQLNNLEINKAYRIEVKFPDNADRTFIAAIQESKQLPYPVSYGVDTGGPYPVSNKNQQFNFVFWPRTNDPRIVFLNAHDGKRIAISRIRIYELTEQNGIHIKRYEKPEFSHRSFVNWYEEGGNFSGIYGAVDTSIEEKQKSIARWFMLAEASGVNVIVPTVAVYADTLFPSQYDSAFSNLGDYDFLRWMMLTAQKYHINIIPEIHPRADPLLWPYVSSIKPYPNTLMSKEGVSFLLDSGKNEKNPRYFNPIYPQNQDWYVNLIAEIAERYRTYDNFQGMHLRLMPWANPALNNFVSLDWGYDDYTFKLFINESGLAVPLQLNRSVAADINVARERYDWIIRNWKEQWISWRCKKIADLYQRIINRIHLVRPDLKVYSHVFWPTEEHGGIQMLREAGIDPDLLSSIAGVELVNSQYAYGRREPSESYNLKLRSNFFDHLGMTALTRHGAKPLFMTSAAYFEVTDEVVKPSQLGFPATVRNGWISAAAPPPGRLSLERYATVLAETDALMLGDGGNMFTFGQSEIGEFMKDFTSLPSRPFKQITPPYSEVALWELNSPDGHYFYVVNRTPEEVIKTIKFNAPLKLTRIATEEVVLANNGQLVLNLKPFELRSFKMSVNERVLAIH